MRPALVAAVGCGMLGGSLVGIGALGFDKVPVEAAACADGTASASSAGAPTAAQSGPLGDGTTTAPTIGARKPGCEAPPPDTVVIPVPGGNDTSDVPGDQNGDQNGDQTGDQTGDQDPADPTSTPTPGDPDDPTPGATPKPTPEPTTVPDEPGSPVGEPVSTPRPTPVPTVRPTPRPTPVPVLGNEPTSDPVVPPPSTNTRGHSTSSPPHTLTPGFTGTITRAEVIARAVSWVTQAVPYSQVRWWSDLNGSFRQDCSGFVSMVWRTDQRINYWTGNLGTIANRIPSSAMQPGDILLLPSHHTLIFLGWANTQKTKFHLFEEYRTGYPARLVRNASLSYYLDRGYGSYSYEGIRNGVASVSVPLATPGPVVTPEPTPEPASVPATATTTTTTTTAPAVTSGASGGAAAHEDTVALLSAHTNATAGATPVQLQTWTIERTISGLPATDWTPATAEDYTPENNALNLIAPNADSAELALADLPVNDLVAAQTAVDRAEEQRLAATTGAAPADDVQRTSGAGYILVAGLGLLFIAIPLGAAARRRSWTPASTAVPIPPSGGRN